jgi:hypothetical protein
MWVFLSRGRLACGRQRARCVSQRLDVSNGAGGSHQLARTNLASPLSAFSVRHLPSRLSGWIQCDACRALPARSRLQKPPRLCRPLLQQTASLNPVLSVAAGPQPKGPPGVAPHQARAFLTLLVWRLQLAWWVCNLAWLMTLVCGHRLSARAAELSALLSSAVLACLPLDAVRQL